ncbi:MAG TPA: site-specific integrase, partial [Polyangia bacterium]|nr:site-specific integrase [Polyangia bacterium]
MTAGAKRTTKPRTGTVEWVDATPTKPGHYRVRITTSDGRRPWIHCDPSPRSPQAEERAREKAAHWSERAEREGITFAPARPPRGKRARAAAAARQRPLAAGTVAAWAALWLDAREAAGVVSVSDDRQRYRVHVDPVLGPLAIAAVTKDDVRRLVAALDEKVRDPAVRFSWKTANHVWILVRGMFKDACSSKRAELVVRADDPTDKVRPPDRGEERDRTYLYPSEFAQLVSCKDVPAARRRLYALAAYTLSRAGELRALRWEDVDLDRGVITLRQASDRREHGRAKRTKSGKSRRIPIEPALRPLLDALRREAEQAGSPLVVRVPVSKNADLLQRDLEAAGLKRAALFPPHEGDASNAATWAALTFHDLRGTGVTWMALRGDEPLAIQQRAGHADFATTQRYLREAETLGHDAGEPFPALPEDLLGGATEPLGSQASPPDSSAESSSGGLSIEKDGAGHGVRTRDPQLGKL